MAKTVIGFFDDATEAQTALQRLESSGISRDRIDLSSGNSRAGTTGYSSSAGADSDKNESGISRFFDNLFGGDDDDKATRYSKVASSSNSIIAVHAHSGDEAERAADILDECGAIDVDERASSIGYTGTSRTDDQREEANLSGEVDTTFQKVEENLNVGKRTEESGGVRVRSRIVERPVEEHVRLREEHINVERKPVDRPLTSSDAHAFQEKTIELTESAEVPVVSKEARVVEEIRISKDVTERNETIRDNVRHTEVDIDRIDETDQTNRKTGSR